MADTVNAVVYPRQYEKGRPYVKAFGIYAVTASLIGIIAPSTFIHVFSPILQVIEDVLHLPTPSADVTPEQHAFFVLAFTFTLGVGGIYIVSGWPLWERGGKLLVEIGLWTRLLYVAASWSVCFFTPYGSSLMFFVSFNDLLTTLITMWGAGISFADMVRGLTRSVPTADRPVNAATVRPTTQGLVFPRSYDAARVSFLGHAAYAIFSSVFSALYPDVAMAQLGPLLEVVAEFTGLPNVVPSTIEEKQMFAQALMFSSAIGGIYLVFGGPYWNRGGKALVESSFWTRSIYITAAYACCFLTSHGSALLFTVASFDIALILITKVVSEASWGELIFGGAKVVSILRED